MNESNLKVKEDPQPQYGAGKIPCDFCGHYFNFLIPINDSLWAICRHCFAEHYGGEEE